MVDVWLIHLDRDWPEKHCYLDEKESAKSKAFHFPVDRERYAHAHAALRCILGSYLGVARHSLAFDEHPLGKPALRAATPPSPALEFNLSHAGAYGALALAADAAVGVDIETLPPRADAEFMRGTFHPQEAGAIHALPPAALNDAFGVAWTRKEAVLKALGKGFALGPASLVLGWQQDMAASMDLRGLAPQHPLGDTSVASVHVRTLSREPDFVISVARCNGPIEDVRVFSFSGTGPAGS